MSDASENYEKLNNECDAVLDLIPAYALGALDDDERRFVEAKLPECPEAEAELDTYAALSQAMLFTAPPIKPPASLESKLMAQIAPKPTAVVPPSGEMKRVVPQAPAGKSLLQTLMDLFIGRRQGFVLAGLAFALFLVSNVYWMVELGRIRTEQTVLTSQMEEQEALLQLVGAREMNRVELHGEEAPLFASLVWTTADDNESWIALLNVENLPALPTDRVYQLWLIRDEQATSAGLFRVDESGKAILVFRSTEPIATFERIAVSEEPTHGSDSPSTSPIVAGQI
jgi:anti-sigma-K factor RskA